MPVNAFVDRLSGRCELQREDVALLREACNNQRSHHANQDLVREGDPPGHACVVLQGWAYRYKLLSQGTRQITAFLMPGDCYGMHAAVLDRIEHSIATITPARIATIPRGRVVELSRTRAALSRAFWWTQMVEDDTLRAWMVNIGRRTSVQRVAHLMCEIHARARHVGHVEDDRLELPLTQELMGDALGLTAVHVNRVLRKLRLAGAMKLSSGSLEISDVELLHDIAGFDGSYLHLGPSVPPASRIRPPHRTD